MVGINEVSLAVARLLISNGYDVTFIVKGEDEGKIARKIPAYVYVGDPTSEDFLEKVGINEAELVISFLDDETNLRISMIAKSKGVPTVLALVSNKEEYFDRLLELGVYAVPIVDAILSKIAYYLKPEFKQLLFADDHVQAYYVVVSMDSPYIGNDIEHIERRCGVVVPLVIRNNEVLMRREGLRIEAGDKVLIVGRARSVVECIEKLY